MTTATAMRSESIVTEADSDDDFLIVKTKQKKHGRPSYKGAKFLLLLIAAFLIVQFGWRRGVAWEGQVESNDKEKAMVQIKAKPILYVHFHKSGGTTACKIMKTDVRNGGTAAATSSRTLQRVARGGFNRNRGWTAARSRNRTATNCNVTPIGPKFNVGIYKDQQNCKHIERFANENPDKMFLAIEVPLTEALPCSNSEFRSMAIMRDPVQRALSHLNVHKVSEQQALAWIQSKAPCPSWSYVSRYPILNNMITRQLIGRDRYNDTQTPINDQDLVRAKEIVDQFDVFVPLEYLSHTKVQDVLEAKVPEYYKRFRDHGGGDFAANKAKEEKKIPRTDEFVKMLEKENAYDRKLYNYMLQKLGIRESAAE